ncbi:MAG TPA: hypothetical protein VNS58_27265 [Puia sp.]|nr:hypothetical protein [Puia sp.]
MKKIIYGLAAVVVALGAVTTTKAKATKTTYYYFPYTTTNHLLLQTLTTLQTTDPYTCPGTLTNCASGTTQYHTITGTPTKYRGILTNNTLIFKQD